MNEYILDYYSIKQFNENKPYLHCLAYNICVGKIDRLNDRYRNLPQYEKDFVEQEIKTIEIIIKDDPFYKPFYCDKFI